MIDFRYHIVSLIAVFLALAVGVVLGAGPLRGSIGDQLQVQIEQLREEKEALRIELEAAQERDEETDTYIEATAGALLADHLAELDIAVVEAEGADTETTDLIIDRIEQAGGTVSSRLALASRWTDPADAGTREELAAELRAQMVLPPPDDATAQDVLGTALGQALTEEDPLSPGLFTSAAQNAYALLLAAEVVTESLAPSGPADAVLVVAPPPEQETDPDRLELMVQTAVGLGTSPVVVAGADSEPTDLVDAIRADDAASSAVSTVDSAHYAAGQVIAPLALAAAAYGAQVGHYGMAEDAEAVVPHIPAPPQSEDTDTDPVTDDEEVTDESTDDDPTGEESDSSLTTEEATV